MNSKLTPVSEIVKLGHGQRVTEIIVRIVNACRPYNQTDRDAEYGWHRQLVNLEGGDGQRISMTIYSEKMHLPSSAEGQVWRFRCLPSDSGPRGIEMKKWQPAGSTEVRMELKMTSQADATRLPFLENESTEQPRPEEKPAPEPMPDPRQGRKPDPDEVEELVMADIISRREMGRKKYGTTMERDDVDLIGWLQHRYEEILDDAIYTRRAIRDLEYGMLVLVPADELAGLHDAVEKAGQKCDIPAFPKKEESTFSEDEKKLEAMSEAPVEKPGRNSKAPQGSDPLREKPKPEPKKEEPKSDPRPEPKKTEEEPVQSPVEAEKSSRLKYIAANVRHAYDDDASDDQVTKAHDALRLIKNYKYKWSEVMDALTAKSKREEPTELYGAYKALKSELNRERPDNPLGDEQVCEIICKTPSLLRRELDRIKSPLG